MKYTDWLHKVMETGNLCGAYSEKVSSAMNKLQLINLALDTNGISYMQEMQAKGIPLPYSVLVSEFYPYLNGKYIAEFKNENKRGYTSCMYCSYQDDVYVETTLVTILNCDCNIHIGFNSVVHIYLDKNCKVRIFCPQSSFCMVDYWGDAVVDTTYSEGKVEVTKKD